MCVCVCERERDRVCVCVCVCATETRGDLSASSKQRTVGHTLMLGMDSQTIVCLIILCLLCIFLVVGRQGSSPTEYH